MTDAERKESEVKRPKAVIVYVIQREVFVAGATFWSDLAVRTSREEAEDEKGFWESTYSNDDLRIIKRTITDEVL